MVVLVRSAIVLFHVMYVVIILKLIVKFEVKNDYLMYNALIELFQCCKNIHKLWGILKIVFFHHAKRDEEILNNY